MRIFMFISFILLLIGGWSLGWFYVADQVDGVITQTKQKLADNGQNLDCASQEINGFPFRISLNCENLAYANPAKGVALSTGALKSAAQAYQPNKVVAEVTSPANLTLPGDKRFETQWASMRTSLSAGLSGPERFSLQGETLKIIPGNVTQPALDIVQLQIHGRKNGDEAVDFSLIIDDATTQTKPWPDYDLNLDIKIEDIYSDLMKRTDFLDIARQKGIRGELHNLKYSALNGGSVSINGPIDIDPNGIVTGKFQVTVSELPKIFEALSQAFPDKRNDIQKAGFALSAIAGSKQNNAFTLPITVNRGKIIIGFFPIGEVPPLY